MSTFCDPADKRPRAIFLSCARQAPGEKESENAIVVAPAEGATRLVEAGAAKAIAIGPTPEQVRSWAAAALCGPVADRIDHDQHHIDRVRGRSGIEIHEGRERRVGRREAAEGDRRDDPSAVRMRGLCRPCAWTAARTLLSAPVVRSLFLSEIRVFAAAECGCGCASEGESGAGSQTGPSLRGGGLAPIGSLRFYDCPCHSMRIFYRCFC